jgi:hypothetical protein
MNFGRYFVPTTLEVRMAARETRPKIRKKVCSKARIRAILLGWRPSVRRKSATDGLDRESLKMTRWCEIGFELLGELPGRNGD